MSKRPGSSTESNAPKRQRRRAGFRAARPPPALSGASSSSNTALFVTVTQADERRSGLTGQSRALPNTYEPSASITPSEASELVLQPQLEDPSALMEDVPVAKSKRKRLTRNAVRYHSTLMHVSCSNSLLGSTKRVAQVSSHIFGWGATARRTRWFYGSGRLFPLWKSTGSHQVSRLFEQKIAQVPWVCGYPP